MTTTTKVTQHNVCTPQDPNTEDMASQANQEAASQSMGFPAGLTSVSITLLPLAYTVAIAVGVLASNRFVHRIIVLLIKADAPSANPTGAGSYYKTTVPAVHVLPLPSPVHAFPTNTFRNYALPPAHDFLLCGDGWQCSSRRSCVHCRQCVPCRQHTPPGGHPPSHPTWPKGAGGRSHGNAGWRPRTPARSECRHA